LEWDCVDRFQRHCYPLLAALVGDYPAQVMIAQVSYGSCPIWDILKSWADGAFHFWTPR
jgi:hypothetical protein